MGFYAQLCQCMHDMMEMRLEIKYGDCRAKSSKEKKDQSDKVMRGKSIYWRENGDWQGIAAILDDEQRAIAWRDKNIRWFENQDVPNLETPCLGDVRLAAAKLGVNTAQVVFEIHSYAARKYALSR